MIFHYRARDGRLQRLDPRARALMLLAVSLALLLAEPLGLAVLALLLGLGYRSARLIGPGSGATLRSFLRALWSARVFLFIVAFVVLSRSVSFAGTVDTGAGLHFGARLVLALLAAHLFTATTPRSVIVDLSYWASAWSGPRRAARLSLMTGLTLSFVAVIEDEAAELRSALRARGLRARRRPLLFLKTFAVALIRKTAYRAETMTEALLARGYADRRSTPRFSGCRGDVAILSGALALVLGALLLPLLLG